MVLVCTEYTSLLISCHSVDHAVLVEEATASTRLAETLDLHIFKGKFVIVRDLFASLNLLLRVDDNLLLPLNEDNFGGTVGLLSGGGGEEKQE